MEAVATFAWDCDVAPVELGSRELTQSDVHSHAVLCALPLTPDILILSAAMELGQADLLVCEQSKRKPQTPQSDNKDRMLTSVIWEYKTP